jgi:hypothetical protein
VNTDKMTSSDVAAYLKIGIGKARHLLGGEIPATYIGRQWITTQADVDAYVKSRQTTGKHRRPKGQRGRGKSLGAPARKAS